MRSRGIVIGLALTLLGATPALAEDPSWSFSTSVNVSRGDYGTKEDTTIVYVPFTFGVAWDRFGLSLTVPYIHQNSQTVSVTGGGVAVRKEEAAKLKTAKATVTRPEGGLGDLLLRGSVVLLEEKPVLPEIAPYVKIKFPTADSDKGLGTGKYDETIGVDVSKTVLGLTGYLTTAYTFIGSPPGADLRDSFGWSIGAAYRVVPPFSVFAFLDGATAIAPGQEDPLELRVGAEVRLTKVLKLTGSVTKGLSNGSADWGLSAGLALRF